jgi:hypothetical protein
MTIELKDGGTKKAILIGGGALGLLILMKTAAAATEGNIVASEPLIYGQCENGVCVKGTEVIVYVTFKNVGGAYKENRVGIGIDGVVLKEVPIGLYPGTGFTMAYSYVVNNGINNICGLVA